MATTGVVTTSGAATSNTFAHAGVYTEALFRKYDNVLREWLDIKAGPLSKRFKKIAPAAVLGDAYYIKAKTGHNERGNGARLYDVALPTAGAQRYDEMYVTEKANYGVAKIDMRGWKSRAKDKTGSIDGDMGQSELKDLVDVMAKEKNRQMFGNGRGILGVVYAAATSGTTLLVEKQSAIGGWGAQYIRPGMYIDTYAGSSIHVNSNKVADVTYGTTYDTLTMTDTLTNAADGDYIFKEDVYDGSTAPEIDGLDKGVEDGTLYSSFQGLTISSNPLFASYVDSNSGTPRAFSLNLLETAENALWKRTGAVEAKLLVTNKGIQTEYVQLAQATFQINASGTGSVGVNLGTKGSDVKWADYEWVVDKDCQYGRIYLLNDMDIAWMVQKPFGRHAEFGEWLEVIGYDQAQTYRAEYSNLAYYRRNSLGVIKDIAENTI